MSYMLWPVPLIYCMLWQLPLLCFQHPPVSGKQSTDTQTTKVADVDEDGHCKSASAQLVPVRLFTR